MMPGILVIPPSRTSASSTSYLDLLSHPRPSKPRARTSRFHETKCNRPGSRGCPKEKKSKRSKKRRRSSSSSSRSSDGSRRGWRQSHKHRKCKHHSDHMVDFTYFLQSETSAAVGLGVWQYATLQGFSPRHLLLSPRSLAWEVEQEE